MRIRNHRLLDDRGQEVRFERTASMGPPTNAIYLIMHYTAGRSLESTINWFKNKEAKASAHIVIGGDGTIVQMVPFNRRAWHAGTSRWGELEGMNQYSIGIELDNAGKLERDGDAWASWFGARYPPAEVLEATHKNETSPAGWHRFTAEQIEAAMAVGSALHAHYGFVDVLGHDDISPGRKVDPGPAFPMISYRSRVFGRD